MKRKKVRKLLAGILPFIMIMTMLPGGLQPVKAYAAEGAENEPQSVGEVYQITTAKDLKWFADKVNGGDTTINGKLMNDIDLSSVCHAETSEGNGDAVNWTPIGNRNRKYNGTFDGNEHMISGLYIERTKTINNGSIFDEGLFGNIGEKGTVKNLAVDGSICIRIIDDRVVETGGIAGKNDGMIENCVNSISVVETGDGDEGVVETGDGEEVVFGADLHIGGIVGGNCATVKNCCNNGNISLFSLNEKVFLGSSEIGGVTGQNNGIIENSYNYKNIRAGKNTRVINIGGVAGENCKTIKDSYNKGNIDTDSSLGKDNVGGVVGINHIDGIIENCFNSAMVSGEGIMCGNRVGGVTGQNTGTIEKSYNDVSGNICVSGKVNINEGNIGNVGGVAGYNASIIKNSFNNGEISAKENVNSVYMGGVVGQNNSEKVQINEIGNINFKYVTGTIENCYNSGCLRKNCTSGAIGGIVGASGNNNINNCYYLTGTAQKGKGNDDDYSANLSKTEKSAEEFKSGEVAYLLNSAIIEDKVTGSETSAWGQLIGKDAYPTLAVMDGTTQTNAVYRIVGYKGNFVYSNKNENGQHIDLDLDCDGICDICGKKFEYAVIVTNGIGSGNYEVGTLVTVIADTAPSGQEFDKWVVDEESAEIILTDATKSTITFKMPVGKVEVTATFKDKPTARPSSGSSYSDNTPTSTTAPTAKPTITPTQAPTVTPSSTPEQTAAPTVAPTQAPTTKPTPTKTPDKGTTVTDKNGTDYKVVSNGKTPTVAYKEPAKDAKGTVSIPSTTKVNGVTYKVTEIAQNAFKNETTITKIETGDNVKTISDSAFSGCTNLKTISLGKNVTSLGDKTFANCKSLTAVSLPSSVTKIGTKAFTGCDKLKTITIKSTKLTAKNIAKNAFAGISKNTVIKVPASKYKKYVTLLREKGLGKKVKIKKIKTTSKKSK